MKESPSGNPVILERLLKEDFVGGFAVIAHFPSPASADADCPSVVNGNSKGKIRKSLLKDPQLHQNILQELGCRFQDIQSQVPVKVRTQGRLRPEKAREKGPRRDFFDGLSLAEWTMAGKQEEPIRQKGADLLPDGCAGKR